MWSKFNTILYVNLIVSLSAGLLTYGVCDIFEVRSGINYALFSFFGTYSVYNGQRLWKSEYLYKTKWLNWVNSNKRFIVPSIVLTLCAAFYFILLIKPGTIQWILLVFSTVISLFYVSPWNRFELRSIRGLKIHLIAIAWTVVLIAFPLLEGNMSGNRLLTFVILHYFYVFAVTIPFDIRDLKYDSPDKRTTPQIFGVVWAKRISIMALSVWFGGMLILQSGLITNPIFVVAYLIQMVLLAQMNENRGDFYCAGLIDGAIAILGIAYLLD